MNILLIGVICVFIVAYLLSLLPKEKNHQHIYSGLAYDEENTSLFHVVALDSANAYEMVKQNFATEFKVKEQDMDGITVQVLEVPGFWYKLEKWATL